MAGSKKTTCHGMPFLQSELEVIRIFLCPLACVLALEVTVQAARHLDS